MKAKLPKPTMEERVEETGILLVIVIVCGSVGAVIGLLLNALGGR